MHRRLASFSWIPWVLCVGACLSAAPAAAESGRALHLRGSTTLLQVAQRVAEAFLDERPGVSVSVSGGGSHRGYKALLDGTADIALTSGPPTAEIRKRAERRQVQWRSTPLGYEAVVALVHSDNPILSLTAAEMQGVFSGRIRNWRELGGADLAIELLRGPPSGGLAELWRVRVLGEDASYDPRARIVDVGKQVEQVAANPAAIGVVGLAGVGAGVRALAIDGVAASPETVRDGSYPVRGELALVTLGEPKGLAAELIRYFADPAKGLRLLSSIHAIPLTGETQP
jgi:phosphate transport system substrate-binding protein